MFVLLGLPTNTTITRSTSDLVELKIWYSKNEKYTYVNNSPSGDGNYIIGAVTGKGLIDELVFDMYFYNGGNAYEKILTYNVNEPLVTPSFSKSDDAAIQYHTSSPLVELPMYFSCFNLLLMLWCIQIKEVIRYSFASYCFVLFDDSDFIIRPVH